MAKSRSPSLNPPNSPNSPKHSPTPSSEFWAGARDIIPLIVGAIPFGIIFGTLATAAGLSLTGTLAMSIFVFAGSSQFIAVGLVAAKTIWPLIVLTTFVVNLRHLLYAISLLPHVKQLPQVWKVLVAFWLTDETFAVGIRRYQSSEPSNFKHWYYAGAALAMYLNWQVCTLLGITAGQLVPNAADWGLDFAMSVTFIGMVVPYVKNKPMGMAVTVAGVTALLGYGLPHKLGLMIAAITGISAGILCEKMLTPKRA